MDTPLDVLDAFVDGELVDAAALKRALSLPEGRDYLVDAWLLREAVQEEIALDSPVPVAAARTSTQRTWLVAAAVAGVCLLGGYFAGTRLPNMFVTPPIEEHKPVTEIAAPPPPPPPATSFPLPAATRVIRLELDAKWVERTGGS